MVQSPGVGAAYVHGGAHAHCLKTFEYRYLIRVIIAARTFSRLELFLRHGIDLFKCGLMKGLFYLKKKQNTNAQHLKNIVFKSPESHSGVFLITLMNC
jgi:hypothetical protein